MANQFTGVVKLIKPKEQVSEKFAKREFVVTDATTQYPQHISFQCTNDRCSLLDNAKTGDTVNVHYNLQGREWTSPQGEIKYFNTLVCWKLDVVSVAETQPVSEKDNSGLPF